jgi:hypothetical protein
VDPLTDKCDYIFGRLVYRRVFMFRFVLENLPSPGREAKQLLQDICSSFPMKVTTDAVARFLQVPGYDKGMLNVRRSLSASVKHDERLGTLDLLPLHTLPLFRPSRSSIIAGCRGSSDPPTASQRMSQYDADVVNRSASADSDDSDPPVIDDEISNDEQHHANTPSNAECGASHPPSPSLHFAMETLRLRAFSIPHLRVAWMVLDCYAPTSQHAASVLGLLLGGNRSPVSEAVIFQWDEPAMNDLILFFWDAFQCLSRQVKHFYSDASLCESVPSRKKKKLVLRLSRILLFHSVSYWTVSFLHTYGYNPQSLLAFSSIDAMLLGGSQYERIKTLRLLSLSLRMRSKVPKLLGGRFHAMVSEKFRPVLSELWSLCSEVVGIHDSDEFGQSAELRPLCVTAKGRLALGQAPLSNPFPPIYEAILEFLPLAVDHVRNDVREIRKGYPPSWPASTPPPTTRKRKQATEANPPSRAGNLDDASEAATGDMSIAPGPNQFILEDSLEDNARNSGDLSSTIIGLEQRSAHVPHNVAPIARCHGTDTAQRDARTALPSPERQRGGASLSGSPPPTMCSHCKDLLYQFLLQGRQKGYSPSSLGSHLWDRLHKRHLTTRGMDSSSSFPESQLSPSSPPAPVNDNDVPTASAFDSESESHLVPINTDHSAGESDPDDNGDDHDDDDGIPPRRSHTRQLKLDSSDDE